MNKFKISKYYDLIFKDKTWIRRISEKIDIEDPEDTKKNISYDLSMPKGLITWKQIDPDNTYSSNQKILPLMFMRKIDLRKVDATINDKPVSVTSKCNNELIKSFLLKESEKRIDRYINNFTDIIPLRNKLQILKNDISEGKEIEKFEERFEGIKNEANKKYKVEDSKIKDIKNRLNVYLYVTTMLNNFYVFSLLIPSSIHVGDRVIVKVSLETPDKDYSPNKTSENLPLMVSLKRLFNFHSEEYNKDNLYYNIEGSPMPYSYHVLINLPEGVETTDFRYSYKKEKEPEKKCRNLEGIKNGKLYINEHLKKSFRGEDSKNIKLLPTTIIYRVIPKKQGIRRWSFILSCVVPLLVIFSIFANSHYLAKDSGERSAVVTVLATFSVLFNVWMAKGVEIPIYANVVRPLRFSIVLYLIGTYLTIIVVIIGDGSKLSNNEYIIINDVNLFIWKFGWALIYAVFSSATAYSLMVHLYYHNLRSGHMVWSEWWICFRWFCILAFFGSPLIFPIIWFLDTHDILNESIGTFEWVIIGINIIYLFFIAIIFISIPFRPNPRLNNKPTG